MSELAFGTSAADCRGGGAARDATGEEEAAEEADGPAYGETAFTEVPQFAKSSLVPPQVARVRVNAEPVQLGY
jgi:hypothetical protein